MLKKIIHKLLRHRHFWRDASFDELSEIYASMMLRSLALNLIGIFVPVFLLKTGYSLSDVCVFYIWFFVARVFMDVAGGYSVARFGPKHTMLLSYIFQIAAAGLFLTLPGQHWPLLMPAILWGSANSLFYIAFHVDFSKVKHSDHGGKELGYVGIMERIGATIGPLVGGILATIFGAQYIFLIAIVLLLAGLIPLFKTAEPVKTHQHLDFWGLPVMKIRRDLVSHVAFSLESNLCLAIWPIFLTLFVFTHNTYATLGILASIGVLIALLATYSVGRLVDEHKGGVLLRLSAIGNAITYLFWPFANGVPFVLGINIVNELLTVGYKLPYTKGVYDAADQLPGHRIVYVVTLETSGSFVKLLVWIHLYLLASLFSAKGVLVTAFGIAAVSSLLIMTQRFPALAYKARTR